jgi:hypothetical protein
MDGNDGIAGVVLAGEKRFSFELVDQAAQESDLAFEIGVNILAFFAEIKVGVDIVGAAPQVCVSREDMLKPLLFAHDLLRTLRIGPQVRIGSLLVDFG